MRRSQRERVGRRLAHLVPLAVTALRLLRPTLEYNMHTSSNRRAMLMGMTGGMLLAGSMAAQTTRRIKVAQFGVQHAHATKLNVYRNSPDYEVVGIAESDAAARQKASQSDAFRDLPWMSESELLSTPGLEVVLIESHVRDSLRLARMAIEAGKHVHLDKPAGHDLAAYTELIESARQRKLIVQMGYMYRYNPAVLLLSQFLAAGWLGDIYEVHAVIGKRIDAAERRQLAEFPGGIMFELGCHLIDLVVRIIGPGARLTTFNQHLGDDGLGDNMLTVFELPRILATVKTTALEIEGGSRRHLVVCGTQGTFHIQPLDNPVATISLHQPKAPSRPVCRRKPFQSSCAMWPTQPIWLASYAAKKAASTLTSMTWKSNAVCWPAANRLP